MATIDLGRIKFKWQGAYNGATAYVVDDVVSYNGSSYVCILASTGNVPTNTTYWSIMAQAGTDITSLAGLAQGDILYYDGSNWVRLGAGTSGQFLQTQGTGANPQWATNTAVVKQIVTHYDTSDYTLSITGNSTPTAGTTLGTITPTSASSKIICNFFIGIIAGPNGGPSGTFIQIWRSINGGAYSTVSETNGVNAGASGSRNVFSGDWDLTGDDNRGVPGGFGGTFVDTSHNTTNSVAYKLYVGCGDSGTFTYTINKPINGYSAQYNNGSRTTSVLMEV